MQVDLRNIASLVERQFPSFYRDEGETFLQFVRAYYEWMDAEGPLGVSRHLDQTFDVDETSDTFLDHYLKKYLHGIPNRVLGDKRLFVKNIQDLYRSKGSIEGMKLLFRLLYKQEVNVYVPEVDMLRASDGKWRRRKYLEVSNMPLNYTYRKKFIRGSKSGAVAYVEAANKVFLSNQMSDVLYLTNIIPGKTGKSFIVGEYVLYDGIDLKDAPKILGSPVGAIVDESDQDFARGERLLTDSESGQNLIFVVKDLYDTESVRGYIRFKLEYGGFGYAKDSLITVNYDTATTGTGANFKIARIANAHSFTYNLNRIKDANNTLISAVDYGANLNFTDVNSALGDALVYNTQLLGTIKKLEATTSGDHQYDGSVVGNVYEWKSHGYGIEDPRGTYWGNDAVVLGPSSNGNGVVQFVQLVSSGLGFNANGELLDFYSAEDDTKMVHVELVTGAVGQEEGYWENDDGFLNADKYIQDSDYYQEFSYEIQIEKSLDKYIDVLKKVMHPVGNKVFGKVLIQEINTTEGNLSIAVETLEQT
jgi:hypothetical protein